MIFNIYYNFAIPLFLSSLQSSCTPPCCFPSNSLLLLKNIVTYISKYINAIRWVWVHMKYWMEEREGEIMKV